jgi:lipopolysaccharide/colanic/teichoic acid biosynthesis glycosyltransferase
MNIVVINHTHGLPHLRTYRTAKRAIDLGVCVMLLPLLLPVIALSALAIWLDSPGPIVFAQDRIGRGGRCFRIFKFRTMQQGYDDSAHRTFMISFVRSRLVLQPHLR